MRKVLSELANGWTEMAVGLAAELIRERSYSGREGSAAQCLMGAMKRLGYDEVDMDEAGNVIGRMHGAGGGKSLLFNGHLDVVAVGDESKWEVPPFEGRVERGFLHGRGATDMKGPLAAQVCAPVALKAAGLAPKGDVIVTGVVHEEDSGLGAMVLMERLRADYAIVGEATNNDVAYTHRGRFLFDVHVRGRSAHASTPELGVNPHFFVAEFLRGLPGLETGSDPFFGVSSVVPTLVRSDQTSSNVIPGEIVLTLDYRNVPPDTADKVQSRLGDLADRCAMPGIGVEIIRVRQYMTCHTGFGRECFVGAPAFGIEPDNEYVLEAREVLASALDRDVRAIRWPFATDSGHITAKGIPCIGFGPSEFRYLHTNDERISVASLTEALVGNMAMIHRFCNRDSVR